MFLNGFNDTESALTTPVSMFAPIALLMMECPLSLIKCEISPEVVVFPFVPVTLIFVPMYLLHSLKKSGQSLRTILPIIEVPEDSFVALKSV